MDTKKLKILFNSDLFNRIIIVLIILNAMIVGLETYPLIMTSYGKILSVCDTILLYIFTIEIIFKIYAYRGEFFSDSWNVMDVCIIVPSLLLDQYESLSVLRILRVFRILRLISASESLRAVVEGLIRAIPGLKSISAILLIIVYIFGIMSTKLFAASFPGYFGSIEASLFSLFQITTLQGASITRDIANAYSFGAGFFVVYILISTFCILNLCVAVIVDAVRSGSQGDESGKLKKMEELGRKMDDMREKMDKIVKTRP